MLDAVGRGADLFTLEADPSHFFGGPGYEVNAEDHTQEVCDNFVLTSLSQKFCQKAMRAFAFAFASAGAHLMFDGQQEVLQGIAS